MLPGGFSYGDYLRCGAIARFSPIMQAVKEYAAASNLLLGICNGFQILCDAGLLPGALIRNRSLHFVCQHQHVRVENVANPFLHLARTGATLHLPIAHGEGSYVADPATLRKLDHQGRVLLRRSSARACAAIDYANPNGLVESIAGIVNEGRNVLRPAAASRARLRTAPRQRRRPYHFRVDLDLPLGALQADDGRVRSHDCFGRSPSVVGLSLEVD